MRPAPAGSPAPSYASASTAQLQRERWESAPSTRARAERTPAVSPVGASSSAKTRGRQSASAGMAASAESARCAAGAVGSPVPRLDRRSSAVRALRPVRRGARHGFGEERCQPLGSRCGPGCGLAGQRCPDKQCGRHGQRGDEEGADAPPSARAGTRLEQKCRRLGPAFPHPSCTRPIPFRPIPPLRVPATRCRHRIHLPRGACIKSTGMDNIVFFQAVHPAPAPGECRRAAGALWRHRGGCASSLRLSPPRPAWHSPAEPGSVSFGIGGHNGRFPAGAAYSCCGRVGRNLAALRELRARPVSDHRRGGVRRPDAGAARSPASEDS